jgi:hypothetical protein
MIAIELRTQNCFICRKPIEYKDRVTSGHFRATDCDGGYISVIASWHHSTCKAAAEAYPQEKNSEQGCLGPYEEWMGIEVDHTSESPYDVRRRIGSPFNA